MKRSPETLLCATVRPWAQSRLWAPALLLGIATFSPAPVNLQIKLYAQAGQSATQSLLDKAHALEVRGRMDMASQTWQQVLLADPSNTEALGGLARAAKLSGNQALASTYIERLRAINPNDPNIQRVENLQTQKDHNTQLAQAGKLAQAGQYAQAMQQYREVYGNEPPPGDSALAYYETEAATEDGRAHAIAGLRSLSAKFPSDSRYQIQLGRILTYNPKTRPEGRKLLAGHPNDPQAVEALRQSLLWDSQNPATAGDIRAYLSRHNDAQLAQALKDQPRGGGSSKPAVPLTAEQQAAIAAERSRSVEDQAGYRALNAKHLEEAEKHFRISLAKNPDNASALAGMGYVRMQQANFGGAISFLAQAKQDGAKDPGLDSALATSHFWYTMGEGALAMNENDLPNAEKNYRSALQMRPTSPEALEGLGGTLLKAQQFDAAQSVFASFAKVKPQAPHAWRGLVLAEYGAGNSPKALETERRIPPAVRAQLMKDPLYLRTLASAYSSVGRDADAQRVLRSALDLPFPADAKGVEAETQLQFAGLLQAANHLDQAGGLYRQVLTKDQKNAEAWKGLVRVQHAQAQDPQALQTIEGMPPQVYQVAMTDPGFEQTVASIYQGQNRLDIAQGILEKAVQRQEADKQKPSPTVQIQLAGIYLQRGEAAQAYPIYQKILTANPERLDAWKGLLSALHSTGRDQEALAQVQQIPPAIRVQLEADVDYLQTVGAVYAGLGQPRESQVFLARVQQYYINQKTAPPADVEIQSAWLLYNGMNDAGLYRELMTIGGRTDLTDEQRRTVQTIWTNWAVRRANQAAASNHSGRAIDILNAAAHAFPDNPGVLKALAAGYARAGNNKQAVLIWKTQDMSSAPASDYKAAVGVALAAGDAKDAETWLRFGLDQYPNDAQLLILGAKFEQQRGDTSRAAEYYRASINAMPAPDPGAELATELSRPAPATRLPNGAAQSKDLSTLLQPTNVDAPPVAAAEVAPPPADPLYLPSYNTQYGSAPVPASSFPATSYPAGGTVVPSYMANPSAAKPQPAGGAKTSLKDYVPQASADEPIPMDGTEMPRTYNAQVDHGEYVFPAGVLSPASYQAQQVSRLTAQVAGAPAQTNDQPVYRPSSEPSGQLLAQNTMPLTQNPSGQLPPGQIPAGQVAQPRSTQNQSNDGYGPYVPYVPPTPTSVQLGATPQQVPIVKPEVTDVLPTARYVPNSKVHNRTPASPDAAAANAAAIRRQKNAADAMSGMSVPPPDDYNAAPTQNVQYTNGTNAGQPQNGNQVDQTTMPRTAPTQNQNQNYTYPPANTQNQNQTYSYPANTQQPSDSNGQQYPQPYTAGPAPARSRTRSTRRPAPATAAAPAPAPQAAPMNYPAIGQPLGAQPYPAVGPSYPLGQAPTDADLVSKRVPALRSYDPTASLDPAVPLTERQQAERDLAALEGSYSGWIGGTGYGRYRSGRVGLDRLTDIETSAEASAMIGNSFRLTVVPTAVFLNSGAVDPNVYTGSGTILGTYLLENPVTPSQQYNSGIGGEIQIATPRFAAAVGYTPYEFLVQNVTARLSFQATKHFTFYGERQPVKETQLSYAGLRDPGSASPVFPGNIWGGVMSTGGGLRFDLGDERSGFYILADGADLTGVHTLENSKFEGSMGAYFLAHSWPQYGKINVGATLYGEHFAHNERGMTYGLGGYFSPTAYFLAAVPVTFSGHYKSNFHYTVAGSIGVQSFQEENAVFFPLDPALQTAFASNTNCTLAASTTHTAACAQYPVNSNTGFNYGLNSEGVYRIADHWYAGGFMSANNTNNYNTISGGFFIRYMFRQQIPTDNYPTGLFPTDGFRPLRVP